MFFVVSGFLITRVISRISGSPLKPDVRSFYTRRAGRIFPLYFLVVLFGIVMFFFFQSQDPVYSIYFRRPYQPYDLWFWGSLFTFTANWYYLAHAGLPLLAGNYWFILWSLSVEEQFYFFYPLILKILKTRKQLYLFLIGAIFTGPLVRNYDIVHNPQYGSINIISTFGILDSIAAGALLFIFSEDFNKFFDRHKLFCSALCMLGFSILSAVYWGTFYQGYPNQIYIPSALSLGLFVFLLGGLHLDFFKSKVLWVFSLPGKFSYGIYLLHESVLYFIRPYLTLQNGSSSFLAFVSFLLGISFLSYRFLEVPSNQFIRTFFRTPVAAEQRIVGILKRILANFMKLPIRNKIALLGFGLAAAGIAIGFWGFYSVFSGRVIIFGITLGVLGSAICLFGLFYGKFQKK